MSHRESLFPSRRETTAFGNLSVKRHESGRRQSSVPQFGLRSTQVGSFGAGAGLKADPRPLRNADYVRTCATRVEDFIKKAAPRDALSPKAFSSPTVRDFGIIWETLLHAFDAKWCKRVKGKKVEDQVATVMKGLGYAFTISKSALSAPGATHSWPQIVAALDWLVDVIELKSQCESERRQGVDEMETDSGDSLVGVKVSKLFDWMTESYEKYMGFDDAAVREIDQSLLSEIHDRQERQKIENAEKRTELESVEEVLKKMQQTPSPLTKMKAELEDVQQGENKLQAKIEHLKEVIGRLEKKSAELKAEIESKGDQIKRIDTEIEKLRERVSKQSINKEGIMQLINERQKLDQMLQNARSHKTAVENEVNSRDVQRDGLLNQLETCVHSYNNQARKLKLIPAGNKHSCGMDFSIQINRQATQTQDLCKADHKGVLQPGLMKVKEQVEVKCTKLNQEVSQLQQNKSRMQEEIQKLQQQHGNCVLEIQKVEKEAVKYKEAMQTLQQQAAEQLTALQKEIDELHRLRHEMVQNIEQKVPEAEARYQEIQNQCQKERKEVMAQLMQAAQKLQLVRSSADEFLQKLRQKVESIDGALQQLMQE